MTYNDSNPERRNLIGLSLSIIVFYLAGGAVTSNEIKLQVVNITFSKPEVLALTVWLLLLWFLYRYWLLNQGGWKKEFYREMETDKGTVIIFYKRMKNKFSLQNDYSNSYFIDKHWFRIERNPKGKFILKYIYKDSTERQFSETSEISGFVDRLLMFICVAWLFLTRPALSTYFMPYVLFFVAVIFGVMSKL